MENVQYVADSLIATKLATKFKAIKTFTLDMLWKYSRK